MSLRSLMSFAPHSQKTARPTEARESWGYDINDINDQRAPGRGAKVRMGPHRQGAHAGVYARALPPCGSIVWWNGNRGQA